MVVMCRKEAGAYMDVGGYDSRDGGGRAKHDARAESNAVSSCRNAGAAMYGIPAGRFWPMPYEPFFTTLKTPTSAEATLTRSPAAISSCSLLSSITTFHSIPE